MERQEKIQALCDLVKKACLLQRSNPKLRYAQALFNQFTVDYPDMVVKVVGTDLNPFYCEDDNDPKIHKFCDWFVENLD